MATAVGAIYRKLPIGIARVPGLAIRAPDFLQVFVDCLSCIAFIEDGAPNEGVEKN